MSLSEMKFPILGNGYLRYVNHLGTDEEVVEAARMSTGKEFLGWYWEEDTYADSICGRCLTQHLYEELPLDEDEPDLHLCTNCWATEVYNFNVRDSSSWPEDVSKDITPKLLGKKGQPKDLSLLETLMANRHATPFEMGELVVEVKAPIMVFREWHRHRTQSYNEMSGRYIKMPNDHYLPELARVQKQSKSNKQGSEGSFDEKDAGNVVGLLGHEQALIYKDYEQFLGMGVAKEVARLNTPVSRLSRMRAKSNLRNWLGFLSLRMDLAAQWEIRQYALAVGRIVKEIWPKTFELWMEHEFMATRFSRSEMEVIRQALFGAGGGGAAYFGEALDDAAAKAGMSGRRLATLRSKIYDKKEEKYADTLNFLNGDR